MIYWLIELVRNTQFSVSTILHLLETMQYKKHILDVHIIAMIYLTFTKNAIDEAKNIGVQLWPQNKIPFSNKSMFRGLFKRTGNTEEYSQEEYQQLLDNLGNTYIDTLSNDLGTFVKLLNVNKLPNGYHMVYETDSAAIDGIHAIQTEFNSNLEDHYIFTKLTDDTFSIDQIKNH